MNKRVAVQVVGLLILALCGGQAMALTLTPPDSDLGDLEHSYYYTWGINMTPVSGQQILSAQLFFDNIYDWTSESNDILYVHLLDNATVKPIGRDGKPTGKVTTGWDNEKGGDAFAGQGTLLFTYSDTKGGLPSEDVKYTFTANDLAVLNSYWLNNGVFGFGFDPDCHYFNDGVYFTFEVGTPPPPPEPPTPPVPEPLSLVLMSMGLGGFALRRRFLA